MKLQFRNGFLTQPRLQKEWQCAVLDCIYWYLADPALFQIGNLLSETLVLRFLGADSVPLAATLLLQGRAKPPNDQRMKFLEKLFFLCVPGCPPNLSCCTY